MHEWGVTLKMVWGFAVAGFVACAFVAAGAALTTYAMIEPSLPPAYQLTILPLWVGPCVLAWSLAASYLKVLLAFHRLRQAPMTAPAVHQRDSSAVDQSLAWFQFGGSSNPEQGNTMSGGIVRWSSRIKQAHERESGPGSDL